MSSKPDMKSPLAYLGRKPPDIVSGRELDRIVQLDDTLAQQMPVVDDHRFQTREQGRPSRPIPMRLLAEFIGWTKPNLRKMVSSPAMPRIWSWNWGGTV